MTKEEKRKLLSRITAIINELSLEEKAESTKTQDAEKVELLTIKECVQESKVCRNVL